MSRTSVRRPSAATAAEKSSFRFDTSSLTGGGRSREDAWKGSHFRVRGRAAAPGLPLAPFLEAEGVSETWSGDLFLAGAGPARQPAAEGPLGTMWRIETRDLSIGWQDGKPVTNVLLCFATIDACVFVFIAPIENCLCKTIGECGVDTQALTEVPVDSPTAAHCATWQQPNPRWPAGWPRSSR